MVWFRHEQNTLFPSGEESALAICQILFTIGNTRRQPAVQEDSMLVTVRFDHHLSVIT